MNSSVMNFHWAALLLVLFLFLIIFIADYRTRVKRRALLKQELKVLSDEYKFHFKEMDFLGHKLIAYDAHNQALAFIWLGREPLVIDLKTVTACRINERNRKQKLQAIELQLLGRHHELLEVLPIYKRGHDNELLLSHLIMKAEEWQQIITDAASWTASIETRLKLSD